MNVLQVRAYMHSINKIIYKFFLLLLLGMLLIGCESVPQVKYYDVYFKVDEQVVRYERVLEGSSASLPEDPTKEGYSFIGWDKEATNINADLTINAIFSVNQYTVRFYVDGILVKQEAVNYGEKLSSPLTPTKEGYTFIGWDKSLDNITSNLDVNALFTKQEVYYMVVFKVDGTVVKEEQVLEGKDATPPNSPSKEGFTFVGWDQDYNNITKNLEVNAVFSMIEDEYVSYVDNFTFKALDIPNALLEQIFTSTNKKLQISNVIYGKTRGTNEIHVYDQSNIIKRNSYGFEVAVDANGVVVAKATLVDLPINGFIISAHGTGIDKINVINIGDAIAYDDDIINVYYDSEVSKIFDIYITINKIIDKIEVANANYQALNYQMLMTRINEAITSYNQLLLSFSSTTVTAIQNELLAISFALVESIPVQTRAYWHYPLYSKHIYKETNQLEVEKLLDEVKAMGFNMIYLNTNSNGNAVYKSQYLRQHKTNNYTYGTYKDYLECFIAEAHKRGIKVTAWTNTLIAGDGSRNNDYKEEWLQKGINGENNQGNMYFLDISNSEVQELLLNVMQELSGYDLDGVEFDFIRFPSGNIYNKKGTISDSGLKDWGYTDTFIAAFKKEYTFTGDFKSKVLEDEDFRNAWLAFKRDYLSEFVKEMTTKMREVNEDIIISAAVMSSISTAKNVYLQDWELWANEGWIDTLDPMIYSGDNEYVLKQLDAMYKLIGHNTNIVAGLFPETDGGLKSQVPEQIADISSKYAVGWAKFSSKNIFNSEATISAYKMLAQYQSVSGYASNEEKIQAYVSNLKVKILKYYSLRDDENYEEVLKIIDVPEEELNPNILESLSTKINNLNNETIKEKLLLELEIMKEYVK